jgi:hypothetical protein
MAWEVVVVETIGAAIYFVSHSGFCGLPLGGVKNCGICPLRRASRAAFAIASSIGDGLLPPLGMTCRPGDVLEIGSCFPLMDYLPGSATKY